MANEQDIIIDSPMEQAVAEAMQPNYLGDSQVIQALLRELGRKVITRIGTDDHGAANFADVEALGGILLGHGTEYTPVPGWNAPGGLDAFLRTHADHTGESPEEVVMSVIINFILDLFNLYSYAYSGALPENWEWQVDALCEHYTGLFIGVLPPKYDEAFLKQAADTE